MKLLFFSSAKSKDSSETKFQRSDFKVINYPIYKLLNIGRWIGIAENVPNRSWWKNWLFHYLLPGILLIILILEVTLNVLWIDFAENKPTITLTTVNTYSAYIGRVTVMIVIIKSFFKSGEFYSYITKWEDPTTSKLLLPYQTELRHNIKFILTTLIILMILFSSSVDILNIIIMKDNVLNIWYFLRMFTVAVECGILFYFLYLCAALCTVLKLAFRSLCDKMKFVFLLEFESRSNSKQYSIWRLRQMHQILCDLVANTNKLLSPNLTIVIVSQATSICFNLYTATVVLHAQASIVRFVLLVCCMLIRFTTIAIACISADRLTKEVRSYIASNCNVFFINEFSFRNVWFQAAAGLQYIHTASWLTLSQESHFQVTCILRVLFHFVNTKLIMSKTTNSLTFIFAWFVWKITSKQNYKLYGE